MALLAYEQKEIYTYKADVNKPQPTNNLEAADAVGPDQLTHLHVTTS
jgi:hypothetical protein